jgi:hypothetical protein
MRSREEDPLRRLLRYYSTESVVEDVNDFDLIEQALRAALPADFKSFHMSLGGGCTLPPLTYVRFYPLAELPQRQDVTPASVVEFATDDSSAYAFDTLLGRASAAYPVVSYPLSSTDRDELQLEAEHFRQLLERLLLRLEHLRPL